MLNSRYGVVSILLSFFFLCVDFSFNQFYHIARLECKFEEGFVHLNVVLLSHIATVVNFG